MADQKLNAKFPTVERVALGQLRTRFTGLQRRGFQQAIRAVFDDMPNYQVGILPDGWLREGDTFVALEIEDSNPLSFDKLWKYCQLWDVLDFYDLSLRLLVFDRYGQSQRELDLGSMYADVEAEANRVREREAADAARRASIEAAEIARLLREEPNNPWNSVFLPKEEHAGA